ncbi:(2Fe-2S)-binding protein [Streptomyces sp. NPDC127033]|uniref:(2Fe-2S)-binding protein n=1 Tax=Streptomyces sp. NPDC127033 TaxID=3347110 RepID=UPI0036628FAE
MADSDAPSTGRHSRRNVLKAGAGGAAVAVSGGVAPLALAHPAVAAESALPSPASTAEVTLRVNGVQRNVTVESRVTLLDALRERLGVTGPKKGCDRGECGACTVLVEGRRVKSCMTLAVMEDNRDITTVEGLARKDELHPVQAAFIQRDAFQCGFCTSGQIMSAVACIKEGHTGSDAEIRDWMSGNLCRCGCYPNIVEAVRDAAKGGKL